MPVSFEGLEYKRYTFKIAKAYDQGGCRADVYMPDQKHAGPCPIGRFLTCFSQSLTRSALLFHGGGFTFGDSFVVYQGQFKYLLERGFAVVSAEYRMLPQ